MSYSKMLPQITQLLAYYSVSTIAELYNKLGWNRIPDPVFNIRYKERLEEFYCKGHEFVRRNFPHYNLYRSFNAAWTRLKMIYPYLELEDYWKLISKKNLYECGLKYVIYAIRTGGVGYRPDPFFPILFAVVPVEYLYSSDREFVIGRQAYTNYVYARYDEDELSLRQFLHRYNAMNPKHKYFEEHVTSTYTPSNMKKILKWIENNQ